MTPSSMQAMTRALVPIPVMEAVNLALSEDQDGEPWTADSPELELVTRTMLATYVATLNHVTDGER